MMETEVLYAITPFVITMIALQGLMFFGSSWLDTLYNQPKQRRAALDIAKMQAAAVKEAEQIKLTEAGKLQKLILGGQAAGRKHQTMLLEKQLGAQAAQSKQAMLAQLASTIAGAGQAQSQTSASLAASLKRPRMDTTPPPIPQF